MRAEWRAGLLSVSDLIGRKGDSISWPSFCDAPSCQSGGIGRKSTEIRSTLRPDILQVR